MVTVRLDCPYCHTMKVAFQGSQSMKCDGGGYENILLLQCGSCFNGVVAKYIHGDIFRLWTKSDGQHPSPGMIGVWPIVEPLEGPKYLPDNIRSFFLQGLDSLRHRGFDAAGTMFRKSLDVALKRIHPEGRGVLQKRIDALPPEIGITPAMKQWAHEIRDLGNDAAHEEEPFSEAEATALHAFTEMFLTYAFTLPGMLAERKKDEPPA